jgi:RHS repeat-associated protein
MLGSRLCGYRIAEAADHVGKIDRIHRDAGSDTTGTVLTTWDIQFPANYRNAFHVDPEEPFRDLRDWFGSLIQDKADESGLIYMRNRYYDPATGKFTEEDPIGLAGGLNLYGFAGGDPINFSDPFGLCPEWLDGIPCLDPIASTMRPAKSTEPSGVGGSEWGYTRTGGTQFHNGFDWAAAMGTEVVAPADATVRFVPEALGGDLGSHVQIDFGNGASMTVGHLDGFSELVPEGTASGRVPATISVHAGAILGFTGTTGNAGGQREAHAHIITRVQGATGAIGGTCNPRDFLSASGGGTCRP